MPRHRSPSDLRRKERRAEAARELERTTVKAINNRAEARMRVRVGAAFAGYQARCSCGWAAPAADTERAAREGWRRHALARKGAHELAALLAVVGMQEAAQDERLPVVERLTGDLDELFEQHRDETAPAVRAIPFYGRTMHIRPIGKYDPSFGQPLPDDAA